MRLWAAVQLFCRYIQSRPSLFGLITIYDLLKMENYWLRLVSAPFSFRSCFLLVQTWHAFWSITRLHQQRRIRSEFIGLGPRPTLTSIVSEQFLIVTFLALFKTKKYCSRNAARCQSCPPVRNNLRMVYRPAVLDLLLWCQILHSYISTRVLSAKLLRKYFSTYSVLGRVPSHLCFFVFLSRLCSFVGIR